MRATQNRSASSRASKRALSLAIGTFVAVASSSVAVTQAQAERRLPGARHDVNLLLLDPNDAPIRGAVVTVQHLGAIYRLVSDQWGIARQTGAQPYQPSLSGSAIGFAGAGETFGVVAAHPSWGATVRTFHAHPGGDGCGPVAYTYRIEMGGPQAALAPIHADPVEPEPSAGCSVGETHVELRLKTIRDEPCKNPNGLRLACTNYVCGQPIAAASGSLGSSGSTASKQTLEYEVSAEARARLSGLGVKIETTSSSTTELSSEITSSMTWNWAVGQSPLPAPLAGHSGELCIRTAVSTFVFEEWRAVCEPIPPTHPGSTSPGTRWKWTYFGDTEVPLTMGTCTDLSGLTPDARCKKNG